MFIWQYLVLVFSVIVGGSFALLSTKSESKHFPFLLCLSGSYIFGIGIIHLLPEVFEGKDWTMSVFVAGGFFFQILVEHFSKGVEHGHLPEKGGLSKAAAIAVMIGLSLHSLIEGIPLGKYTEMADIPVNYGLNNHLFYGIVLHKIPAAFALVSFLRMANYRKISVALLLLGFALTSPFSAFVSAHITWSAHTMGIVMAFVVGSFLQISTTILFESTAHKAGEHNHDINWRRTIAILLGLGLAAMTM